MKNDIKTQSEVVSTTTILSGKLVSAGLISKLWAHCRYAALTIMLVAGIDSATASSVWFSSLTPASASSGVSYGVYAIMTCQHTTEIYCFPEITIYKNGNVLAHNYGNGPGYCDTSEWTTDYGAQTVEYIAEATDHVDSYEYAYWWVEIS